MKGGLSADKIGGFTQFNVASSLPLAAQNEGGLAGLGAGFGAATMLGQAMAQSMAGTLVQPAAQGLPSAPAEMAIEERLEKLKVLLNKGLISSADYDSSKAELLKKLIG